MSEKPSVKFKLPINSGGDLYDLLDAYSTVRGIVRTTSLPRFLKKWETLDTGSKQNFLECVHVLCEMIWPLHVAKVCVEAEIETSVDDTAGEA